MGPWCLNSNGVPNIYDASYNGPPPTWQYLQSWTWESADAFLTLQTQFVWYTPLPTGSSNAIPEPGYHGGEVDLGFILMINAFSQNSPNGMSSSFFTGWLNSAGAVNSGLTFLGTNPPGNGLYISAATSGPIAACSTEGTQVMKPWEQALQVWLKTHPGQAPPSGIATPPSFSCGF